MERSARESEADNEERMRMTANAMSEYSDVDPDDLDYIYDEGDREISNMDGIVCASVNQRRSKFPCLQFANQDKYPDEMRCSMVNCPNSHDPALIELWRSQPCKAFHTNRGCPRGKYCLRQHVKAQKWANVGDRRPHRPRNGSGDGYTIPHNAHTLPDQP